MMGFWEGRVVMWRMLLGLYHVMGCRVFEDLSALCGHIGHSVPW